VGEEPLKPEYPYTTPSPPDDGTPDPDKGKDLWGDVPTLGIVGDWGYNSPSFNLDPPNPNGNGPAGGGPEETMPIRVNMISLRTALTNMGSATVQAIAAYEDLKATVRSTKDHVFGQDAIVQHDPGKSKGGGAHGDQPGQTPTDYGHSSTDPSPLQAPAKDFASGMNPAQEKVLEEIANSLELLGQFMRGVDTAGQAYSATDRKAVFPEPPPSPVTST
jgi:hypothetical protein